MAKETPSPVPTDVDVPALDTHDCRLTPLVLAALAAGATARNHDTDQTKIVLTFPDRAPADAFSAAVAAALA